MRNVRLLWTPALLLGLLVGCSSNKNEENTETEGKHDSPVAAKSPKDVKPIADLLPSDAAAIAFVRPARGLKSEIFAALPTQLKAQMDGALDNLERNLKFDPRKIELAGVILRLPPNMSEVQFQQLMNLVPTGKSDSRIREDFPPGKDFPRGKGDPLPPGKDGPGVPPPPPGDCGEDVETYEVVAYAKGASNAPPPKVSPLKKPAVIIFGRYAQPITADEIVKAMTQNGSSSTTSNKTTSTIAGKEVITVQVKQRRNLKGEPDKWEPAGVAQFANLDEQTIIGGPDKAVEEFLNAPRGNTTLTSVLERSKNQDAFLSITLANQPMLVKKLKELTKAVPAQGPFQELPNVPDALESLSLGISLQSNDPLLSVTFSAQSAEDAETLKKAADGLKQAATGAGALLSFASGALMQNVPAEAGADAKKVMQQGLAAVDKMIKGITVKTQGNHVTMAVPNPGIAELVKSGAATVEKVLAAQAKGLQIRDKMHNLGVGMHDYAESWKSLPISSRATNFFKDGKPNHSWLTGMLPFMENRSLHDRLKPKELWNSEANKPIAESEVKHYSFGATGTKTRFRVFSGPGTPLNPTQTATLMQITNGDGTANTIACIFASEKHAQHWMDPTGIPFDPKKPEEAIKALGPIPKSGVPVLMCDGAVRTIYPGADPKEFAKMVTYNDGQVVDEGKATGIREPSGDGMICPDRGSD